ncbi:MAG TPA: hypothetical protein PLM00_00440 [Spirochaetota bacterium]|nr:hypothetical protein [Spirochaetota bacterium]HPH02450.1 hypothetical protein [Spirochaetota bacterium]HPN81827.1 hypothetical protein [Spirochaetota bacterium]
MKTPVTFIGRILGRIPHLLLHGLVLPIVLLVLYLVNLAMLTVSPVVSLAWLHEGAAGYLGLLPADVERLAAGSGAPEVQIPEGVLLVLGILAFLVLVWLAIFVWIFIQGISRFWFSRVLKQTYRRTALIWRHILIVFFPLAWFVAAGLILGADGLREEITEVAAMTTISHLGVILFLFGSSEARDWKKSGAGEHAVGCISAWLLAPLLTVAAVHAAWRSSDSVPWFLAWLGTTAVEVFFRWRAYKRYYTSIMRHVVEDEKTD